MREGINSSKGLNLEFHPSYVIMAVGFVLTGYYLNLIIFTILIFVHELGHYGMARIFGIRVLKIFIYPYGGKCVFSDFINRDLYEELLVAMSGVLVQFLFYLSICFFHELGFIREYTMKLFTLYSNQMIFFNLLPIYPLDGGRIVNLLLGFFFPYYFSNLVTIGSSFLIILVIFVFGIYSCNYSNLMVFILLLSYLVKFYRNRNFLYQKFLLERYLYDINYSKMKVIFKLFGMYRNRKHFIWDHGKLCEEKKVLTQYFGR